MFKKIGICSAITTAFVLMACNNTADKKPADGKVAAGDTAGVIKIATGSPLSGGSANAGKDFQSGALLAAEDINAKGGVDIGGKKYKIEIVSEDDAGDPKQGATVAQKIADDKSISGVVGHYNSGVTMVAQPIYAKAGLAEVTVSTNPDVTAKSTKSESGQVMVYRIVGHDGMQGPALATYAQKKGIKKLALIDDATAYGKGMTDQVDKKAKELGLEVIHETATDKTTDFKSILTKVKAAGADGILWGGYDDTAATLAKQARELGLTAVFFMPDAVCTDNYIKLAGAAAAGTICSTTGTPPSEMKDGAAFKERFEKRFTGQSMQAYAPFSYDSVYVLVEAIKKAGSTDAAKVAAAMKGITATGLSGNIAFDDQGNRKDAEVTILESKDNKFVPIDKVK